MSYHPRIESKSLPSLTTTRCRNSELWFINNPKLEDAILGYTAKCTSRYDSLLYALSIEGNHLHLLSKYHNANRASFQRDLNAFVARAVPRYVPNYTGGRLWARRYSSEFVPEPDDIEEYFFYVVLQTVQDGFVDKISEYPGYNCFSDAVGGIVRKYKVVKWAEYHNAKRTNPDVRVSDYTEFVELKYERLPGYEELSRTEYKKLMHQKLEERRVKIVQERGKPPLGVQFLKTLIPGSRPINTKTSTITDHRPRVLCVCPERRAHYLSWYFELYWEYQNCSREFRQGNLLVPFPEGMYRPPLFTQLAEEVLAASP